MPFEEISPDLQEKFNRLKKLVRDLGSLVVAYSGGVDSTFLVAVAHEVLGDTMIAATGADASIPERELRAAEAFCEARNIRHVVCAVNPSQEKGYRENGPDRCYFCKRELFMKLVGIAEENGLAYLTEGSNMDDMADYRPGLRAAAELSVKSPLREAGLNKAEIRLLARAMGLPNWDKPASACLASRIAYGETITDEKLRRIDQAEQFLLERGFPQRRVRVHGDLARIEVPQENIARLASEEMRRAVSEEFERIGFRFVALDLEGYRTGSMNATLPRQQSGIPSARPVY